MARIKIQIEEDGTVTRETVGQIDNKVDHDKVEKALKEIALLIGGDTETRKTKAHHHHHEHGHSHDHKHTA